MAVRAAPIAMSAKASPALSSVKSITAPVRRSKTAMMRRNRYHDPVNVDCLLPAWIASFLRGLPPSCVDCLLPALRCYGLLDGGDIGAGTDRAIRRNRKVLRASAGAAERRTAGRSFCDERLVDEADPAEESVAAVSA
jgi:hypothetical protein